jgi:D-tyrosyl-tRNA(Tyr) deacylase
MKAWLQRVSEASVTIDGVKRSEIQKGFLVLLGVTHSDTEAEADKIAAKIPQIRLFTDEKDMMNLSLQDIGGSVLVVSQFTLYADTAHGRRPGFSNAARPEKAEPLYERVVDKLIDVLGKDRVKTGVFGADMKVQLINDGPVSIELLA